MRKLEFFKGRFYDLNELNSYIQALHARTQRPHQYCINVGEQCDFYILKKFIQLYGCKIRTDGIEFLTLPFLISFFLSLHFHFLYANLMLGLSSFLRDLSSTPRIIICYDYLAVATAAHTLWCLELPWCMFFSSLICFSLYVYEAKDDLLPS